MQMTLWFTINSIAISLNKVHDDDDDDEGNDNDDDGVDETPNIKVG